MKPEPLLKSEAPSADLLGLHVAARSELVKARVQSYTRKDGVFVAEHRDNRSAANPKGGPGAASPASGGSAGAAGVGRRADKPKGRAEPAGRAKPERHQARPAPQELGDNDGPDEENPKMALSRLDSAHLASAIRTGADLNKHAKIELAKRGMDAAGTWTGFKDAPGAHGLSQADMDSAKDPDRNPIAGHFQTMHPKLLAAAASGHLDLNAHAKKEAANRGVDHDGKWVGFDKAKQLHLGEAQSGGAGSGGVTPAGDRPLAKSMPMPMGWRPPSQA